MLMAQFVIALDLIRLSVKTSDSVHAATIVINEFYINKTGRKLLMCKKFAPGSKLFEMEHQSAIFL